MAGKEDKKSRVFRYLDNTFGDQGLKTDVSVTLTDKTVTKIIFAGIALVAASVITFYVTRSVFKPKN